MVCSTQHIPTFLSKVELQNHSKFVVWVEKLIQPKSDNHWEWLLILRNLRRTIMKARYLTSEALDTSSLRKISLLLYRELMMISISLETSAWNSKLSPFLLSFGANVSRSLQCIVPVLWLRTDDALLHPLKLPSVTRMAMTSIFHKAMGNIGWNKWLCSRWTPQRDKFIKWVGREKETETLIEDNEGRETLRQVPHQSSIQEERLQFCFQPLQTHSQALQLHHLVQPLQHEDLTPH